MEKNAVSDTVPPACGESPFEDRLERLRDSIIRTRRRLLDHDEIIAGLRAHVGRLQASLEEISARAAKVESALPPLPRKEEPLAPAPPPPEMEPRWRFPWSHWLAYATLAAAGLGLGLRYPRGPEARPPTAPLARAEAPEAPAAESLTEEEASDEALRLVYEYRVPGAGRQVHELISPGFEAADLSQWVLERTGPATYLVIYRPSGDAAGPPPLYEFEVDLAAKTVAASPQTMRSLGRGLAAGAR